MQPKHITTLAIAIAVALGARAQTGVINRIDSMLVMRQAKSAEKYDTAYISTPGYRWTVKLRVNASGNNINTKGTSDGQHYRSDLESDMRATAGASISYRGLSLGFALNPAKLAGKDKDYEFNLNAYGNRVGIDIQATSSKTFAGTAEYGGQTYDVPRGKVSMDMISFSTYYAFSHRRFSFPAAFTQSQVQKRSCGTWMLGISGFAGRIKTDADIITGNEANRLSTLCLAVGGGYAYNFVVGRRWLLHLSVMPQLIVASRNRITMDDKRMRSPFKMPAFMNVGRLAAVYTFGNKFAGMSAVINMWHQGDGSELMVENLKWRARVFYGFRF